MYYPKSKGYGILHENHVELYLHKTRYLIEYQNIKSVIMAGGFHKDCLITLSTSPYEISITTYRQAGFWGMGKDKMRKQSTQPLTWFQRALEQKVKEISKQKRTQDA